MVVSRSAIRRAFHSGLKNGNGFIRLALAHQNFAAKNERLGIRWRILQDGVIELAGIVQVVLEDQNLDIGLCDSEVLWILGVQSGELRSRFVHLGLTQIEIT